MGEHRKWREESEVSDEERVNYGSKEPTPQAREEVFNTAETITSQSDPVSERHGS